MEEEKDDVSAVCPLFVSFPALHAFTAAHGGDPDIIRALLKVRNVSPKRSIDLDGWGTHACMN